MYKGVEEDMRVKEADDTNLMVPRYLDILGSSECCGTSWRAIKLLGMSISQLGPLPGHLANGEYELNDRSSFRSRSGRRAFLACYDVDVDGRNFESRKRTPCRHIGSDR